jgi:hypothetical protein
VAAATDLVRLQAPGWQQLPEEEKRLLNLTCGPGLRLMRQLARVC